ncbi:MAG: SLOG family protein, partial [Oscillospiraceae bacterium]
MAEKSVTCCFTGHRAAKLPWRDDESDPACILLKQKIADAVEAVYFAGMRHYICGMANGCDLYFCEAVVALRTEKHDLTLEGAVPYEGQADSWPSAQQARYRRLIAECDYLTLVSKSYTPDCMQRRNRYMADSSTILIAAYDGKPGGTMSTMLYAMR